MPEYIVNDKAQSNGDHEVHTTSCVYYPEIRSYTNLGWHVNCRSAVTAAKEIYSSSDGCAFCSPECHSRQSFRPALTLAKVGLAPGLKTYINNTKVSVEENQRGLEGRKGADYTQCYTFNSVTEAGLKQSSNHLISITIKNHKRCWPHCWAH